MQGGTLPRFDCVTCGKSATLKTLRKCGPPRSAAQCQEPTHAVQQIWSLLGGAGLYNLAMTRELSNICPIV